MDMVTVIINSFFEFWKLCIIACPESRVGILIVLPKISLKFWQSSAVFLRINEHIIEKLLNCRVIYGIVPIVETTFNIQLCNNPVHDIIGIIGINMRKVISPHQQYIVCQIRVTLRISIFFYLSCNRWYFSGVRLVSIVTSSECMRPIIYLYTYWWIIMVKKNMSKNTLMTMM